jgi:hypothetical protein
MISACQAREVPFRKRISYRLNKITFAVEHGAYRFAATRLLKVPMGGSEAQDHKRAKSGSIRETFSLKKDYYRNQLCEHFQMNLRRHTKSQMAPE